MGKFRVNDLVKHSAISTRGIGQVKEIVRDKLPRKYLVKFDMRINVV